MASKAANQNLTDFFEMWGFFEPVNTTIEQYGTYKYYVSDAMIREAVSYTHLDVYKRQAECQFLVAYYHFATLRRYGPIPITDSYIPMDTPTSEYNGRFHFDYCVDWIANQLDEADVYKRQNQNEHLNVEDALTQSEAFLVKYKNAIIGGVVAVIIIVAGFIMYKNLYAEPREEKAQAALFKGQEYFEQDAYEQALNGDSIGYVGFLKVADEYSGTKAANLAKAYAGICYAQLGKYDEARCV